MPPTSGPQPTSPTGGPPAPEPDGRSDWKVVLQFFLVPLSLVAVLVAVFFGLQVLRARRPDPRSVLRDLKGYEGFLARYVGAVKRWQSGYDLSLLLADEDAAALRPLVPDLAAAYREAGAKGDRDLRRYLALALGKAGDARGLPALREGLRDDDPTARIFAAWGVVQIGGPEAAAGLRAALADPDPGVRKMAAFGLGQIGDRPSAGALRAVLDDGEPDVAWNAALALARLGDPAGEPILVRLVEEGLAVPAGAAPGDARVERTLNAIRGLALLCAPGGRAALELAAGAAPDARVAAAARLASAACDAKGGALP